VSSIFGVAIAIITAAIIILTALGFLFKRRESGMLMVSAPSSAEAASASVTEVEKPVEDVAEVSKAVETASTAVEEGAERPEVSLSDTARPPKKKSVKKAKKPKVITKSLEAKIIAMYRKGKTPTEIARALGISRSSVYRRIKKGSKAKAKK